MPSATRVCMQPEGPLSREMREETGCKPVDAGFNSTKVQILTRQLACRCLQAAALSDAPLGVRRNGSAAADHGVPDASVRRARVPVARQPRLGTQFTYFTEIKVLALLVQKYWLAPLTQRALLAPFGLALLLRPHGRACRLRVGAFLQACA
jgi:hypothetical protein